MSDCDVCGKWVSAIERDRSWSHTITRVRMGEHVAVCVRLTHRGETTAEVWRHADGSPSETAVARMVVEALGEALDRVGAR